MTSADIACQAASCFSSLLLISESKRTSPARAIGSEIGGALLLIAGWVARAVPDAPPPPSLVAKLPKRLVARTSPHRHRRGWAAGGIDASNASEGCPNR